MDTGSATRPFYYGLVSISLYNRHIRGYVIMESNNSNNNNSNNNKTGLIKALKAFEQASFNLLHELAGVEVSSIEEVALNSHALEVNGDLSETIRALIDYTESVRNTLQ